jgi:hypothetical protein
VWTMWQAPPVPSVTKCFPAWGGDITEATEADRAGAPNTLKINSFLKNVLVMFS